jgi:metal transporter CNNM
LIILSALFSGLTLGLMGMDSKNLELLSQGPFMNAEEEAEAQNAKKILPVRKNGNLLLCTLLLGNTAVNSFLSILMADIFSGTVGGLVSTGVIVIFGEIMP